MDSGVFPRVEVPGSVEEAVVEEPAAEAEVVVAAEQELITFDHFTAVDMRVATVTACDKVPKADRLLRFELDVGELGPRQVLSGIAEHYEPDTLIGTQVGALLSGAVVTETIFSLPGVGRLFIHAVTERDYAMVQVVILFIAVVVSLSNLIVDLTYSIVDPRVRYD